MEEQGPPAEPREPGLQATPSLIETPRRISHERAAVEEIRKALAGTSEAAVFTGLGAKNRIAVPRWELTDRQFIQFGDLRVAGPRVQAVVEVESGGGVGNLVKYWPLLREAGPFREGLPFFLLHLFQLASENDFIAHRRLWAFLRDRMRDDLAKHGHTWGTTWYAVIGTYRYSALDTDMASHARVLRMAVDGGLPAVQSMVEATT